MNINLAFQISKGFIFGALPVYLALFCFLIYIGRLSRLGDMKKVNSVLKRVFIPLFIINLIVYFLSIINSRIFENLLISLFVCFVLCIVVKSVFRRKDFSGSSSLDEKET